MFTYCADNPVMNTDISGAMHVKGIDAVGGVGNSNIVIDNIDEANQKYNSNNVNVYFDGIGSPKENMLNAKVYVADNENNYWNINIDDSLSVNKRAEMDAVLDIIIASEYYSEDVFGTKDFMRAQWIAHNLSYYIASSSDIGFSIMQIIGGSDNPIESSTSLDIRHVDNLLKRQKIPYTIISWVL